jgi:hypothetical protein
MSARIAHEQALFSSGDRRTARVIERAAHLKGDLHRALSETGIDPGFYTSRNRPYDEYLPWEIIDSGLSRSFMQQEHERAQIAKSTAPCPSVDQCTRCGVCPTTWLAAAPAGLVQLQGLTASTSRLKPNFRYRRKDLNAKSAKEKDAKSAKENSLCDLCAPSFASSAFKSFLLS